MQRRQILHVGDLHTKHTSIRFSQPSNNCSDKAALKGYTNVKQAKAIKWDPDIWATHPCIC